LARGSPSPHRRGFFPLQNGVIRKNTGEGNLGFHLIKGEHNGEKDEEDTH
jgi:hypothetical protein